MKKRSLSTGAAIITSTIASASVNAQTSAPSTGNSQAIQSAAPSPRPNTKVIDALGLLLEEQKITPEIAAYHNGYSDGQTAGYAYGYAIGSKQGRATGFRQGQAAGIVKTAVGGAAVEAVVAGALVGGYKIAVRRRRKREEEARATGRIIP